MTALTLAGTLSRVMTSCGGTSMVTVLRSILTILSTNGSSRNSPGPLGPPCTRPRRKMTPRSYSFTTFTALYKNEATTTTTTSAMNAKLTPTACNKPKVAYTTNPPLSARLVEISTATGRSDRHNLHYSSLAQAQDPHPAARPRDGFAVSRIGLHWGER